MLCYRDRTYCPFTECKKTACVVRLTEDIIRDAQAFGLPICQYVDKPPCFNDKETHEGR